MIVSCASYRNSSLLPIVVDDMLLFSLTVQFEHTNWSKIQTDQKMNNVAAVGVQYVCVSEHLHT